MKCYAGATRFYEALEAQCAYTTEPWELFQLTPRITEAL